MLELDPSRCSLGVVGLVLFGAATGCHTPAQVPNPSQPVEQFQSDETQRRSLSLTVYNQNLGLVRETRRLALHRGRRESKPRKAPKC